MGIKRAARGSRFTPRVAALLTGLALVLGATGCGEFFKVEYDDLSDVTRVRWGPLRSEARGLNTLETLFVCAGEGVCRPDSLTFYLSTFDSDLKANICPEADRTWNWPDSMSFGCRTDEAELLLVGSETPISVRVGLFWGERIPNDRLTDLFDEEISFYVSYDDVRRIAKEERNAVLQIGEVQTRLPMAFWMYLNPMVSMIEEDANPEARQWDAAVSAHYDAEADSTRLNASLNSTESGLDGIGLAELVGRCPGRGWCREPALSFYFPVGDTTHFSLNLSDVEFVLDDSLFWTPRFVEVRKFGRFGAVEVDIFPEDLEEMVASSVVQFRLDTLAATLTGDQLSVLRRFWQRVADAEQQATPDS